MILLEAPLISAVMSTMTFVVVMWIAYGMHRNRKEPDIPLSERLKHPMESREELRRRCEQQRSEGAQQ